MDYKDVNDYEVLYLVRDDDLEYGDILFKKYEPHLERMAHRFSNQFNISYDDFYEEGLIGLNNAIMNFDNKNDNTFYTYANLCIRSKMIDYVKSKYVKNALANTLASYDDTLLEHNNANLLDTFNNVLSDDLCVSLIHFKNDLDCECSSIFELKLNGFSVPEISKLLDSSKNRVYRKLDFIKSKLNKYLKDIAI